MSVRPQSLLFAAFLGGAFFPLCALALFAGEPAGVYVLPLLVVFLLGLGWVIGLWAGQALTRQQQEACEQTKKEALSATRETARTLQAGLIQHAKGLTKLTDDHQQRATASTTSAAQAMESATIIASAIEEMNSAIVEIGRQADEASSIAKNASEKAKAADGTATALSAQGDKILSIVELIRTIAERTNLLALNATIEAARAGEHGKGFAVVASEVKTLARQTAEATTQIEKQINEVREASHAMKGQMNEIETTVEQINTITQVIKTALHEETAATHEISRSAGQTTMATNAVTTGISHMLVTTEEIRRAAAALGDEAGKIESALQQA